MQTEEINEQIETIVHFSGGKVNLLRFKWKDRAYRVRETRRKWVQKIGEIKLLHFLVVADNDNLFDISYNLSDFVWKIDKIQIV